MTPSTDLRDRALASLTGLALGDALGMPTQSMPRRRIQELYGHVDALLASTAEQPIAPSMAAGSITDDTEQALMVADLLIEGAGRIDPHRFARALADWEAVMEAKGSLDLLGPSTKAAIAAIQSGVHPDRAGLRGTTNGAEMRIAPVGIAFGPDPASLLDAVIDASRVTHNTGLGLAGAAAVAMAVSVGVAGGTTAEANAAAVELAGRAAEHGAWIAGGDIAARIVWAVDAVVHLTEDAALDFIESVVGTSVASQESVVAAFALSSRFDDAPYRALCAAASIGGDTDTIAAIAGAMLGARHGMAVWPSDAVELVTTVNHLDLSTTVDALLTLRDR